MAIFFAVSALFIMPKSKCAFRYVLKEGKWVLYKQRTKFLEIFQLQKKSLRENRHKSGSPQVDLQSRTVKCSCPKMAALELTCCMVRTESSYAEHIILSYTWDHLSTFGQKLLPASARVQLFPVLQILFFHSLI